MVRLPAHNPQDPVENAVIKRLADNWHRRATVKRPEPNMDDLFERDRPDYPEGLVPLREHPTYQQIEDDTKAKLLGWAWIAFNKHIMDTEQYVVNPTFSLLIQDTYDTGLGESMVTAITQAKVDEEYHTLMHLNAITVTQRQRGWRMPPSELPMGHKARGHLRRANEAANRWQRDLSALAFTTVAEISINSYLDLVAADKEIQVINSTTAELHNRDEYCHSSIADQIAKAVYGRLSPEQRGYFLESLAEGLEAFAANDFATWHRIVDMLQIEGGREMVQDVEHDTSSKRLLQNFSGLHTFCADLEILDDVPFDWSTVAIE
jgi:hypothetical protein